MRTSFKKKKLFVNYFFHQQVLSENIKPFVRQGMFFAQEFRNENNALLGFGLLKNGGKMFSLFQKCIILIVIF